MYIFGEFTNPDLSKPMEREVVLEQAHLQSIKTAHIPITNILDVLDRVSNLWRPDGYYWTKSLEIMINQSSFSKAMIESTLEIIPSLLCRSTLEKRISSEMGSMSLLDDYQSLENYSGKVWAAPIGTVLHVTAGNVFLGFLDSLVMGFITKNISLIKLSSNNLDFPQLFAESLKEADPDSVLADKYCLLVWRGGESEIEHHFKNNVDAILAWGGEDMVSSYKDGLNNRVKFFEYGPKLSFQVIENFERSPEVWQELFRKISQDICTWDQTACASPQTLFIQEGIDLKWFSQNLCEVLDDYEIQRGRVSDEDALELHKEYYRGLMSEIEDLGGVHRGKYSMVHFKKKCELAVSPLFRTAQVRTFSNLDEISLAIRSNKYFLQSVGYDFFSENIEKKIKTLGLMGVQRLARIGFQMEGLIGAPHDGRYGLRELVRFINHEVRDDESLLSFLKDVVQNVPYYNNILKLSDIKGLQDFPLMDGETYKAHSPPESIELLNSKVNIEGSVFCSGGTSGEPKYIIYTHEEFEIVRKKLGINFKVCGVKPGEVVANLFVAGNMWSSFKAISAGLKECKALELPIGGMADPKDILKYLEKFTPMSVCGLPSMLSEFANLSLLRKKPLKIKRVFFAGEKMVSGIRELLKRAWGVEEFYSAGYASVDAGLIGYNTPDCGPGEHYLFDDYLHLEVIDGEAIITSKARKLMPMIRFKTGDHVEIIETTSQGTKFKLLGRMDGQIQLWGCKFHLSDIELALSQCLSNLRNFQVIMRESNKSGARQEELEILVEGVSQGRNLKSALVQEIWSQCPDIRKTISIEFLEQRISVVQTNSIPKVSRTGKVKSLIDNRL